MSDGRSVNHLWGDDDGNAYGEYDDDGDDAGARHGHLHMTRACTPKPDTVRHHIRKVGSCPEAEKGNVEQRNYVVPVLVVHATGVCWLGLSPG